MAQQMFVEKLHRLTLVRKGKGTAKHPDMREGVLEVVKSEDVVLPDATTLDDPLYDWYDDFAAFIRETPADAIPEDWEAAFAESFKESAKRGQGASEKQNYPDGSGPFAGPHNSFPIRSQHHVYAAAKLVGHAANPAAVKAAIIRIAHEKGYSLPKSWQTNAKKAEDTQLKPEVVDAALAALRSALLVEDPTKVSSETPEVPAPEVPAVPETPVVEDAEKAAKAQPHNHDHAHASTYGYSYSHGHAHGDTGHADAEDHASSETLHAHVHVAKSGGDPEVDGLLADVTGLKQDLDNERAALSTARAEVETLKAQLAEAQAEVTVQKSQVEEKAEVAQHLYKNLLRRPLTAPTQTVEKSAPSITKETPWDEAFDLAMGRK